jgi:hypothetical protein
MDRIEQYRRIIEKVLTETLAFLKSGGDPGMEYKLLFDRERDSYALVAVGFSGKRRIHHFLIHLEIINDLIGQSFRLLPQPRRRIVPRIESGLELRLQCLRQARSDQCLQRIFITTTSGMR